MHTKVFLFPKKKTWFTEVFIYIWLQNSCHNLKLDESINIINNNWLWIIIKFMLAGLKSQHHSHTRRTKESSAGAREGSVTKSRHGLGAASRGGPGARRAWRGRVTPPCHVRARSAPGAAAGRRQGGPRHSLRGPALPTSGKWWWPSSHLLTEEGNLRNNGDFKKEGSRKIANLMQVCNFIVEAVTLFFSDLFLLRLALI